MKQAMSQLAWRRVRRRLAEARERDRNQAELRLAGEIQVAFPELSRSECLRRAAEKIREEQS